MTCKEIIAVAQFNEAITTIITQVAQQVVCWFIRREIRESFSKNLSFGVDLNCRSVPPLTYKMNTHNVSDVISHVFNVLLLQKITDKLYRIQLLQVQRTLTNKESEYAISHGTVIYHCNKAFSLYRGYNMECFRSKNLILGGVRYTVFRQTLLLRKSQ